MKLSLLLSCILVVLCNQDGPGKAEPLPPAANALELIKESPTLHCLGFRWFVENDGNTNARVDVSYRVVGDSVWKQSMPLRRVESDALMERKPPESQTIHAGSILFLRPDTEYEVKLDLVDPDGGATSRQFKQRTWKEPQAPAPTRTLYVVPGNGGGSGTVDDPFRGMAKADSNAQPGDLMLLRDGKYRGGIRLRKSGSAESPIVWRAQNDTGAVIEDTGKVTLLSLAGLSHVYAENLSLHGGGTAIRLNGGKYLCIRGCRISGADVGISGTGGERRVFVADNNIAGVESWPRESGTGPKLTEEQRANRSARTPRRTRGRRRHRRRRRHLSPEDSLRRQRWLARRRRQRRTSVERRGIEISGTGSVVCHNRVSNFRDGIDVNRPFPLCNIDIHNNDISHCYDDGIELDFSEHNVRVYWNRITNAGSAVSFQPIRGGPAYVVRNVLANIYNETFKLHLTPTGWPNRTSGGVIMHNTAVNNGPPFRVYSNEGPAHYYYLRNNLLAGRGLWRAIAITCPMKFADINYNAYVGDSTAFHGFAFWNKKHYKSIEGFVDSTGQEKNGKVLTGFGMVFADRIPATGRDKAWDPGIPQLGLAAGSPLVDAGQYLPGINDGFAGKAPDIGAIEFGATEPHYGVRNKGLGQ